MDTITPSTIPSFPGDILENLLTLAEPSTIPTTIAPTQLTTTIKMEDLETSHMEDTTDRTSQPESSSPAPTSADCKQQPKKRKSWGQALPEPKTNLPPRKRAKTDDEKEQRRIERVKRNRLAAHNSRERKRQEVEDLEGRLKHREDQLQQAQMLITQQAREIQFFRTKYPGASSSIPQMMTFSAPDFISQNPLLHTSMGYQQSAQSIASNSSPSTSPGLPPSLTESPIGLLNPLDSPATSTSQPATPSTEMMSLFNPVPSTKVDQTQHSAAMLCPGLQCQSTFKMGSAPLMQRHRRYHPTTLLSTLLILFNLTLSSLQLAISNSSLLAPQLLKTFSLPSHLPFSSQSTLPHSFLPLLVQTFMRMTQTRTISSTLCKPAQAPTLCATSQAPLRSMISSPSDSSSSLGPVCHHTLDESYSEADVGWRRSRKIGGLGDGGFESRFREILALNRIRREKKLYVRMKV